MSSKLPLSKRGGFSLVELLVTIAISAIVTTLAAPSMIQFYSRWQLSDAVNSYTSSLQLARSEAVKRGRITRMCTSSNGTACGNTGFGTLGWAMGWIVYVDNDASGAGVTAGDEILLYQSRLRRMDSILSSTSASTSYAFTPFGTLQNGVGAQGLTFVWNSSTRRGLCISFSGRTRLVTEFADCAAGA